MRLVGRWENERMGGIDGDEECVGGRASGGVLYWKSGEQAFHVGSVFTFA